MSWAKRPPRSGAPQLTDDRTPPQAGPPTGRPRPRKTVWLLSAAGALSGALLLWAVGAPLNQLGPDLPSLPPEVLALADTGKPEAGAGLSGHCVTCHTEWGRNNFSYLAGQHRAYVVHKLLYYRASDHPIMGRLTETLDDTDIADIAAFLAGLPRYAEPPADADLAARGASLYRDGVPGPDGVFDCVRCHGERAHGDADLGVPVIWGNSSAYLERRLRDLAETTGSGVHAPLAERTAERLALAEYLAAVDARGDILTAPAPGARQTVDALRPRPAARESAVGDTASTGAGLTNPREAWAGADVYDSICAACHASGVAGAPRVDDQAAWQARYARGFDTLVDNTRKGIGVMPPMGGVPSLSAEQAADAVRHMLRLAGVEHSANDGQ